MISKQRFTNQMTVNNIYKQRKNHRNFEVLIKVSLRTDLQSRKHWKQNIKLYDQKTAFQITKLSINNEETLEISKFLLRYHRWELIGSHGNFTNRIWNYTIKKQRSTSQTITKLSINKEKALEIPKFVIRRRNSRIEERTYQQKQIKQILKNLLLPPPNFADSFTATSLFPRFLLRHRRLKFQRGKPFQIQKINQSKDKNQCRSESSAKKIELSRFVTQSKSISKNQGDGFFAIFTADLKLNQKSKN